MIFFNLALETVINKSQINYDKLNLKDNGRQCGILPYVDDIIIHVSDSEEVKPGIEDLIKNSKDIELQINELKIKYMVIPRQDDHRDHLEI
jgi:Icc-related predicted phosphoesterase